MRIVFILILNVAIYIVANGQPSGWYPQNSGISQGLNSIYFSNDSSAWIVGAGGTILHTNDKGGSWMSQNSPTSLNLFDVDFINDSIGWAVGENGIVIRTDNGGDTWYILPQGTSNRLHAVDFINDNTGWATGFNGTVIYTDDGGLTWGSSNLGTLFTMNDVSFINDYTGFIVGGNIFFRTTNSGFTWQYVGGIVAEDVYHSSVHFPTADSGWVVGSFGDIFSGYIRIIAMTSDGGDNFDYVGDNPNPLSSVYFVNSNRGWAVGNNGTIIHTSNGGLSWDIQNSGTLAGLSCVFFTNDTTGWIVGSNGVILSTNTSGIVAINENQSSHYLGSKLFRLDRNYPNPFNPTTTIQYELFKSAHVKLKVYDLLGKEIITLINSKQSAGLKQIKWNGLDGSNRFVNSGIYIYRLQVDDYTESRKMLLIQ